MKNASAKENLGPLLDKFEAELKAYNESMKKWSLKPDPVKETAARNKVKAVATAAMSAAGNYGEALKQIEKHSNGATKSAATELRDVLSSDIISQLKHARDGNF
jgi:hypothetical protein